MEVDVLSRLNYIRVWFMFSPGKTWREVVTQLPFRQPKRRGRHEQSGHESAAGHLLTIATVALERHDGFSRAFVANRAASAAAGDGRRNGRGLFHGLVLSFCFSRSV